MAMLHVGDQLGLTLSGATSMFDMPVFERRCWQAFYALKYRNQNDDE